MSSRRVPCCSTAEHGARRQRPILRSLRRWGAVSFDWGPATPSRPRTQDGGTSPCAAATTGCSAPLVGQRAERGFRRAVALGIGSSLAYLSRGALRRGRAALLVTGLTLAINVGGRSMIHPPSPRPAAAAQANSTTSTPTPTPTAAADSSINGVSVFPPPGAEAPAGPTPGSAVDTPTPTPTPLLQGADNSGKTKGKHRRGG
jgi:hypothetical protein